MAARSPIFEPDALRYTVTEAVHRFVPNLVWDSVRQPHNHLLYGGQGTGKTMLLRRLSWPAMAKQPDFLNETKFIAFYCDMRELEDLYPLFAEPISGADETVDRFKLMLANFLGALHLLYVIASTLEEVEEEPSIKDKVEACLLRVCNRLFATSGKNFSSLAELLPFLKDTKAELITAIGSPTNFAQKVSLIPSFTPEQTFRFFSAEYNDKVKPIGHAQLGLLLDQYEMIPPECQKIFNPLLKRENSSQFFTIVACRPFSFIPQLQDGTIQPREDFSFKITEYFPEEYEEYKNLLIAIWKKLRPDAPPIDSLFEAGIDYFAKLSSRSVRCFLQLCKAAGALEPPSTPITRDRQVNAANEISTLIRDQLKVASGVTLEAIWSLVLEIYKTTEQPNDSSSALPHIVNIRSSNILGLESLSSPAMSLLKKAFEEGAFQFLACESSSCLTVPEQFALAPILGPALKVRVSERVRTNLDLDQIEKAANAKHYFGNRQPSRNDNSLRSVFLSTSFQDLPEQRIGRDLFKSVFAEAGITVVEGKSAGPGMLRQFLDQILTTDLTIMELSHLSPNIVLEMGLTLGLAHRLIPVRFVESKRKFDLTAYPFLYDMAWLPYSLTEEAMVKLRNDVVAWSRKPINEAHTLHKTLDGATRLRVNQKGKSIAIYFPEKRKPVWSSLLPRIRSEIARRDYDCTMVNTKPHPNGLSLLDNLVWAISRCSRVIIDTSDQPEPDLYGAFALGFSFASSQASGSLKQIRRIEEAGLNNQASISMWPSELYSTWNNADVLVQIVQDFLPQKKRKRRSK